MPESLAIVAWCTSENDKRIANELIAVGQDVCALILVREAEGFVLEAACGDIPAPPERFATVNNAWAWLRKQKNGFAAVIEAKLNRAELPPHAAERFLANSLAAEGSQEIVSNFSNYTDAYFSYSEKGASADEITSGFAFAGPTGEELGFYLNRNDKTLSTPKVISLDLSPQCVKRCAKCQFHSPDSPFKKYIPSKAKMPLEMARKIIREAALFDPKPVIAPTFSGEPLLYPDLRELLEEAKGLGLPVSITTNGMLLKPEISDRLIDLQIDTIMISLDAVTQYTYEKVQAPGNLEQVEEFVRHLLKVRRDGPTLVGLTYVVEDENENEFDEFLSKWNDVDYIVKSHKLDMLGSGNAVQPKNMDIAFKAPCFASLTSLYIRYDGRVALCGYDLPSTLVNLRAGSEMSLQDIWNSAEMQSRKDKMINPPYEYPFCRLCACREGQYQWETTENGRPVTVSPITKVFHNN